MSLSNQDILSLVNSCKQNNRESQQTLYKHLYGYAYTITSRYSNDDHEANALANDSFLKLFKNIHACKLDKSTNMVNSFKGWFHKIIVNTCIDWYRSNKNAKVLDIATQYMLTDHNENGEEKLSYKEILGALKQLSPAYKTVFNLFVIEGLSHDEIAKKLAISTGTSKSNLSKAREHLRTILETKMNFKNSYDATIRQGAG
ncbi:MAG: sigma-70 family polymerase sigma factor [Ferruginibacter sp.]|nr:sigma-70 family polymerase sigma factor [Ferruginibacter sp.]